MTNPIFSKKLVYEVPGMDAVQIETRSFAGANDATLEMDIYSLPDRDDRPYVILVNGFPDSILEQHLGGKMKNMELTRSVGRLLAASGFNAIAYENKQPNEDLHALLRQLDERPVGAWARSGNGALALSLLLRATPVRLRCVVLHYSYTLDLDGDSVVANAASMFHFVNGCAGQTLDDMRTDVPLFMSRAGADQFPGLNHALDRFVAAARKRDVPLTLVEHPTGPHAFDLFEDSETSRNIIRQSVEFLVSHLTSH